MTLEEGVRQISYQWLVETIVIASRQLAGSCYESIIFGCRRIVPRLCSRLI
jgi:hypothetical protein